MTMIELWEEKTLYEAFCEAAEKFANREALCDSQESMNYTQMKKKIDILSVYLAGKGIEKGENILVHMPNCNLTVIVYLSLFAIGARPVLLLPAQREVVINGICQRAKPSGYISMTDFCGVNYKEIVQSVMENNNCIKEVFFDKELEEVILNHMEGEVPLKKINSEPEDIAFLSLSGGTTGIPKLIPRTHRDYIYNARVTASHCQMSDATVMLTVIPVAHNFAFGTPGVIGTLLLGGKVVMCEYPSPMEIFDIIEKEKVTIMSLVPTLVNLCISYREIDRSSDISSLKYYMTGGAMFSPELAKRSEEIFEARLIQVYGMAEGMTFLTDLDAPDGIRHFTQGKPCSPYDEFIIIDEYGNELADNEEGEILVKGPYTISGYYNNEAANKASFRNGYYCTGDKGSRTKSGDIKISGRVREQINRAGEKIMPAELEAYIMKYPKVKECVVAGIPDPLLGMKICVFAIMNEEFGLQELHAFLKDEQTADFYMPDMLVEIDTWPLTAPGKIDKNQLISRLED